MSHIIRVENDLPVVGGEQSLPPSFGNISCPTLTQMLTQGFAEYLPPVYDASRQVLGDYVQEGEAWTRIVLDRPLAEMKADAINTIKDIRAAALERLTKNSGVLAVYDENYRAAVEYVNGRTAAEMKGGQTAEAYLTGLGARLGMTAAQFAAYIISENKLVGPTAYQVEEEYLRLAYGAVPSMTDNTVISQQPEIYRQFCEG